MTNVNDPVWRTPSASSREPGCAAPRASLCVAVLGALLSACRSEQKPPSERPLAAPSATEVASPTLERGRRVQIEAGRFESGTVPGTFERVPEREPALTKVELGPFAIDALPFPNDPERPPLRVGSADEAATACAEAGGRLCTELEWERACKGALSKPFISGEDWSCSELRSCRSKEGVHGLGLLPEWTSSRFGKGSELAERQVIRGAEADAPAAHHRCARRGAEAKTAAFRCCHGPPNGLVVREPTRQGVYRKAELGIDRLRELLAAHPRTEALATSELSYFAEPEAARTVIDRGPGDRKGFQFTVAPLLWAPVPGANFLAVSGRSGERTSFVVVFTVVSDERKVLASSFVMHDEPGPVAFAYSEGIEPRFHFSTCWGCPGETGKVLYRRPDRAVILQP